MDHHTETAMHLHRVQPSAFERDDDWLYRNEGRSDPPPISLENTADWLEAAVAFVAIVVISGAVLWAAWPVIVYALSRL